MNNEIIMALCVGFVLGGVFSFFVWKEVFKKALKTATKEKLQDLNKVHNMAKASLETVESNMEKVEEAFKKAQEKAFKEDQKKKDIEK